MLKSPLEIYPKYVLNCSIFPMRGQESLLAVWSTNLVTCGRDSM